MSYNKVKIRRGSSAPTISNITIYELAYDYSTNKLYIHDGASSSIVSLTPDPIVGGTNVTLLSSGGNTNINVDDKFLKNDASDTTSGTITAAGFTTAGSITIGGHSFNDIDIGSEFNDVDDHLMSSGAIKEKIEGYGYATSTGDITGVTAGTGLSGGGNTGGVTLNVDSSVFKDLGTINVTSTSDGSNSNPFDDAHVETKVQTNGIYALSYTGASAFMSSAYSGGSASVFQQGAHYNGTDFYMRVRTDSSSWKPWRKIWHAGNDGAGTGLDADLLDGYHLSGTRNSANTVPVRDGSGYLNLGWINTTSGNTTTASSDYYVNTADGFIRKKTLALVRTEIMGVSAGTSFLRSDADDTASGQYTFTKVNDHAIKVGTIRGTAVGSQTGQFIQLYERVNIGGPSGWGATNTAAPANGLSTYGGANLAVYSGSVGIGTSSPSHTLDVVGNAEISATLQMGSTAGQSGARISAINSGNSYEFGHVNSAGYRSNLGANANNGYPFLAFYSEAGSGGVSNTYRTRGIKGVVLTADTSGTFSINQLATASADNQSLTQRFRIDSNGTVVVVGSQTIGGALTANYGGVFNEGANDSDFRVESVGNANMFRVDASTNRVGIGTGSPAYDLHVAGHLYASSSFLGPDGSAATPTYRFHNNGNTGMLLSGTNTLGFSTAGATRFTMNATGVLYVSDYVQAGGNGIHIWDSTHGFKQVLGKDSTYTYLKNNDGLIGLHLGDTGDGQNYYSNGAHRFRSASAAYFGTLNSTGLKLGTGYAQQKLDVAGNVAINAGGATKLYIDGEGAGYHQGAIVFRGTAVDASYRGQGTYYHDAASDIEYFSGTLYANDAWAVCRKTLTASHDDSVAQGSNALFIIEGGGDVGIGTSNPTQKLDVAGHAHIEGNIFFGDDSVWQIDDTSWTGGSANQANIMLTGASGTFGFHSNTGVVNVLADGQIRAIADLKSDAGIVQSAAGVNLALRRGTNDDDIIRIEASSTKIIGDAVQRCEIGSFGYRNGYGGSAGTPSYSFSNDTNTGIFRPSADSLCITTAGVQRFMINATTMSIAQAVKISFANGQTIYDNGAGGLALKSPTYDLDLYSGTDPSADMQFYTDGTNLRMQLSNAGGLGVGVTGVATAGRIDASNDVVAYSTSDKRLKENIKPIENALDKVMNISGVSFDWKELSKEDKKTIHGNTGHDVGVIAQEIEKVLPEVVTERDNGYKAVKYEKLVPLLIEAMKQQQVQIDELKDCQCQN